MRSFTWMAMWTMLLGGILLLARPSASGSPPTAMPYGSPVAYGFPAGPNEPGAQTGPWNASANMPYGNAMPVASDSFIDNLTYANYMNMLPEGVQQALFRSAPIGPPAQAADARPRASAPGGGVKGGALDPNVKLASFSAPACPPSDIVEMPVLQGLPVEHVPPAPPAKPNYKFNGPLSMSTGTPGGLHADDVLYHNWLLNLLFKLNCAPRSGAEISYLDRCRVHQLAYQELPGRHPAGHGNNDPSMIGAPDEPGTTILFGAGTTQNTNYGIFPGGRLTAGYWIDDCHVGLEASAPFRLARQSVAFNASSRRRDGADRVDSFLRDATIQLHQSGGRDKPVCGGAANQVHITQVAQLWGSEANILIDSHGDEPFMPVRYVSLVGFRYLDLNEKLSISDTFFDPATNGAIVVGDGFGTRNQFYGGQFGFRTGMNLGRWNIDGTMKIALGVNQQTLSINGATTVYNGAFGFGSGTTAGGVFAEPSNIGKFRRDVFAIIPEGQLKLGYDLTQSIRTFVGYNFLYMNNVIRPGGQLDRNINPTQNPFFVPGNNVTGPLAPLPIFHSSDFWAQGLNIGLECRF